MCMTGCPPSHSQSAEMLHPKDASHDDDEDDEKKVKELSFNWGCHAFMPHLSGL